MSTEKDLLLMSAARLYFLGLEVEAAREKLRELVKQGTPYDSPEMLGALREYTALNRQWKELESKHLNLRDGLFHGSEPREGEA